jgi:hypothetical protein
MKQNKRHCCVREQTKKEGGLRCARFYGFETCRREKKESGKEERCLNERTGGKGEVEAICGGMVGLPWESADRGG